MCADHCPEGGSEEAVRMKSVPYREAVGSLMYLAVWTIQDLATAVGVVTRYSANPGEQH